MPRDRKYRIKASRNGPNDYSFVLENLTGGPPDLVFNKTTDKMPTTDYYVMEFHLQNEPGCDLEFDPARPLSACREQDAVNGCAPEGSSFFPIVFVHQDKPNGKKLLHVVNADPIKQKFFFGISFVSGDGTERAYLDPGGENQNGGIGNFDWSYSLAGAASGAVAAIAATAFAGNLDAPGTLLYGSVGAVVGLVVGFVLGRF